MGTKRIGRVGERDAGFHSNGALPSALSCCHYGSEVFRSCRKQSYDSETTEDETTEPQMETKEGLGRHQDKTGRKGVPGEGGRMTDYNPDTSDRRATLPGTYDPVVERELRALGSRPPGPHLDPTNSARQAFGGGPIERTPPVRHLGVEPLMRASHANLARPVQGTQTGNESLRLSSGDPSSQPPLVVGKKKTSPQKQERDEAKSSAQQDCKTPQSSGVDNIMTPKMARAGPKIFDKVRAFEERRRSVDLPGGTVSSNLDSSGGKTGVKEVGVSQKRAAFQQRASSLEDQTSYSQRVQNYQNKFAEELQRIKKLVGKSSLKKAISTEQLSQKDCLKPGKVEPIPRQVVQKLEARERAREEGRVGGRGSGNQRSKPEKDGMTLMVDDSSWRGKNVVPVETAPVKQLPGEPTATRTSLNSETSEHLGTRPKTDKTKNKPEERASPVTGTEQSKPSRRTPSPAPSVSPVLKKRRAEAALQANTPTILVEDEHMAEDRGANRSKRTEERVRKTRKGVPKQSRSPGEGGSSDDSYMSADEEPVEGPVFEKPLQDTTASCGSEVTLTCIIAGSPAPTVTWRKNNVALRSDAFYVVKSEGKQHSLVIKEMRRHNAGSYCVTAVNAAGSASCSAAVHIQSEPIHLRHGKPAVSVEVSSPVQSDEENLSPQEEAMEVGGSLSLNPGLHFKEPPSFQVTPFDQGVTEGQDVVLSAKVRGQPKPMVLWLKDSATVRTGGRFTVREAEDGSFEMRISSAQKSDSGLYVCKLLSESGTKQAECRLEVLEHVNLKITREVQNVLVKAGESAMFECDITGPPDVDVDWLSNGKLIQPALLNCKMHFDGKRCRLMLNSVHEDDSGMYTCKLSTAKEELTSSANLRVTPSREPLFTRKLDVLEVTEGRTARFDCKVSGSPAPRVTWMHYEARVEESDDVRIFQEGGRHSLVISHVSSDTEGFYTAIAQNIHGKSESTAELYVQEARAAISSHMAKLEKMPSIPEEPETLESEPERRTMPDFVKPLADVEVIAGKEAVLKCKVEGLPYPTISWYHNGKHIESSEERKMTQYRDVHNLVIRSACHGHSGVYKAVIANKVGKSACYAHLYVTDIVPDPPDGPPVIEAISGKTITLSWKPPKKLDCSLDSSSLLYVVQQQPLGSIQWSVVASNLKETHHTVTSLSKGVRYAFRVLTSTGKTLSKPSVSTDLVQLLDRGPYLRKAPVILEKPDIVYVVENQPANITITLNHVHAAITWKRRGAVLVSRPGMYDMSMPDDDQHSLRIQRAKSADIGQLVVTASNQFGSDLCTLQLAMAVAPKFETIMEDVDVHVGETSRLAVVVEGKPDPDILWFKDELLLSESSFFTFVYDDPEYSLVILNAQPEHSGVYTCTAKNVAGSNSCKAELTVSTGEKEALEPVEDEGTILRKMRRLTDYYDIHKEIGRGAFSYVKRVTLKEEKTEFAAKFISAQGKRKASALREMHLLSELDNEKILYFHDAFEKKNVVVLITELCHEELLDRMAKKTTVMEREIRSYVQQILEGLRYLHQNSIAHLDVKPENILMAAPGSAHIRICDFGNAIKLDASEEYYCKYGTPEYVAPEIVNQTPVSTATDIWSVGVIAYLCLTGVSPFAGENDRATALNIRNYNVAFEESMFLDLCKEAKGFVIKFLVVDRLRPSATECLRHPWFKSTTNKSISTASLKEVLSRRRWQRSLISYKSKMVMRSIPELLSDSSTHVSIAVARHLKEGSPAPSSSSDSDVDADELPFVPMPLSMVFSGSRISLNEIPVDEVGLPNSRRERDLMGDERGANTSEADKTPNEETLGKSERDALKKGSSVESNESQTRPRRATMRRGSSADSALLLQVDTDKENANEDLETSGKSLKKAVSMELPNRSSSPGATKLSQEDYALKLELMRQRLLRGGNIDKKMSGLRGPLFETLGMDDERQTGSLDQNLRRSRAGPSMLARAASSESSGEDTPKTKVFRKTVSFTQGDSEPMPLHRRFGAPLEIPSACSANIEGKALQEATSMSALTEQTTLESLSSSQREETSFVFPTEPKLDQHIHQNNVKHDNVEGTDQRTKSQLEKRGRAESESKPVIVEDEEKNHCKGEKENGTKSTGSSASPEHPAVFAKIATSDQAPASVSLSSSSNLPTVPRHPVLRTDIKDIDSEEVFEARFKKRESSLTRGLRKLTRNKSDEKSPILSRKEVEGGEEIYRPGPRGAPLEMVPRVLSEKSKSVQDLREVDREVGLGLIGRLSLRAKKSTSTEKKGEKPNGGKQQNVQEAAINKRVSWAVGRSKSLDTTDLSSSKTRRQGDELEQEKAEESSVSSMRRKFESKVADISAKIRSQSEERKAKEGGGSHKDLKDLKKVLESPVLAMRQRFESKVSKVRSQSKDRTVDEEGASTPPFPRHRRSHSEGRELKQMGIPENQLAKQTGARASKESIESTSSIQSDRASESDRRSRWDKWGLTRAKRDKTPLRSDLPSTIPKEEGSTKSQGFIRSASDFAPVFHIKLKDHILLEGESVTLSCLPAASPHPQITWMKDRKPLEVTEDRLKLVSHTDGRQLLTIHKSSHRDAGVYECVATNPIATITTSCTLCLALIPKRPGTPEVAQTYNNTALVLWKPADTKSPCSYSLERKTEGDSHWVTVVTGIVDCYYNVTDLPPGGVIRFRVSCVNKAGQGPYSSCSAPVSLDSTAGGAFPPVAVVKTVPAPPELVKVPQIKPDERTDSSITSTSSSPAPLQTASKTVVTTPPPTSPTSEIQSSSEDTRKACTTLPSAPQMKPLPSFDVPKPQSPVNVVTPMTQTPPVSPPPFVTQPSTPMKPSVTSVPTYVPTTTATARVAPTPLSFSPQVLQSSSLSPMGEGPSTPTRGTPSGRTTPSTALRQGVPQKPYTFLEEKARGRFGVIRECRENATGKLYMAKIIPYSLDTKQDMLKEYEILKSLHNEKIMALHEAYVTPRYLVLVAEYCTGKELLYSLTDRFCYSEDDVVGYLVQILQAVEYLHNHRILHLDLKPDNIMVTNLNAVKIVDFGSAQSFNPLNLKPQNSVSGTLEYMAPEMVKGEVVGPPADIWTVGVVTYIMLSGRLPFEDKNPQQVESKVLMAKMDPTKLYPNVSQSASTFLKKMLSSYPWARPTTRDCFTQAWLQDSYLMKLRRQTLTFTSSRIKEFLVEQQSHRTESATKHKVLLRTYQGSPQSPSSGTALQVPTLK
uniref:non-specific serine/threonine protein kinase n=1 Tax=Nothobranchius korthausae TaxID=1143690 RepID=A0A1A8ETI8_9TELE